MPIAKHPEQRGRTRKERIGTVTRKDIQALLKQVDQTVYGDSIRGGWTPQEQKLRNRALISLLYLSARRISEIVGRVYEYPDGRLDIWEGVSVNDFQIKEVAGTRVLCMRVRILKRGSKKTKLNLFMAYVDIRLEDPLIQPLVEWLQYLRTHNYKGRVFPFTRQRAWQILQDIDKNVWCHWFRHQRLSHLSSTMTTWQLQGFAKFQELETASQYVSSSPSRILESIQEADKLWE